MRELGLGHLNRRSCAAPFWRGLLLGLAVLAVGLASGARAATLQASLDRDTVSLGESAVLSFVLEGGKPDADPQPPTVRNLQAGYPGKSSQYSWVNGESSSTITYTFPLTPKQAGTYTIPPIKVTVDGQVLASPAMTLTAVRAAPSTPDVAGADQKMVLVKLVVPSAEIFLGQSVPIELDLYLHSSVQNIVQYQSSAFNADGFTFGNTVQGPQRQVRVGNANFTLVPFYTTMTPVKTGELRIEPIDCTMVLQIAANGGRRQDMFDPFGMLSEQRRVTVSTEPVTVSVLALPEGAPAGFNGAVGNYTLSMSAGPTNVAAGDPITVKIQIAGHGNLDGLSLPPEPAWHDFKTYPPTAKVDATDKLGLQGTKNFELVVVPQDSEIKQLPPFAFSYFDPDQKAYRTLSQPAVPLTVRPGAATVAPNLALANRPEGGTPAAEIAPIRLRLGTLHGLQPALVERPWFWATQSVPVLAWMLLLVRRKRADALANNPRLRRQRQVAAFVTEGLAELRRHAAAKESDKFFATTFRLLQERLGERLNLPASSITEAVIDEQLRPRRAPENLQAGLQELFQACNQARYAPVKSTQELEGYVTRIETALAAARDWKA